MAGKRLPSCRHCCRRFKPEACNEHHQQWCSDPACRSARDRARKRKYYHGRMKREAGFRESERRRCRIAMRQTRAGQKQRGSEEMAAACLPLPNVEMFVGLVSQLVDSTDPHVIAQAMGSYAERGRWLAVPVRVRGSP